MKLPYRQIILLRAALASLDGVEKSVEVRGQTITVKEPFKFPANGTRIKIARNLRLLREACDDFEEARMGLIKEICGEVDVVPPEKIHSIHKRISELETQESSELPLIVFTENELNADANRIQPTALDLILEHLVAPEPALK